MKSLILLFTLLFSQVSFASYKMVEGNLARNMINALEVANLLTDGEVFQNTLGTSVSYKIGSLVCSSPEFDVYTCEVNGEKVMIEDAHDLYFATVDLTDGHYSGTASWFTYANELSCAIETKKDDLKQYRCWFKI